MHPIININDVYETFIIFFFWGGFPDCSIQEKHAVFSNQQRRVSITPVSGSKVIVNGVPVSKRIELQHLVCLIICICIIFYMHFNRKVIFQI